MQTIRLRVLSKGDNDPVRLLKAGKQPLGLPISSSIWQRERVEKWRERIWQSQHKYFILLHPQYRELVRKVAFSIQTAGLQGMIPHLLMGVFFAWVHTGMVTAMVDFIVEVFSGRVFLMDDKHFVPATLPSNLPKFELLKALLLYNPRQHEDGISAELAINATPFFDFLGPSPGTKPWVHEWLSDAEAVYKQAIEELGEEAVNGLRSNSHTALDSDSDGHETGRYHQKVVERIAYW